MKQVFVTTTGRGSYVTPIPTPGPAEILVAVHASVISTGTETMDLRKEKQTLSEKITEKKVLWEKVQKVVKEKGLSSALNVILRKLSPSEKSTLFRPVGYSNAGIVVAKGQNVSNFNAGDRVACAGSGIASHAEYSAVPVNLAVKVPETVSFQAAAFTTIGAIAMQGIRRANVTFGETIVIAGLGLLGLIAVQIAKAWGLVVIGTDLNPLRIEQARELGADHCFDARDNQLVDKIKDLTRGYGADAVIIYAATTSSGLANQALDACRQKGRVVIVGAVGMDLQRDSMYAKELDFVMSTSYGPGRYDDQYEMNGLDYPIGYVRWTENRNMIEFVRLLSTGQVKVDPLISNSFGIDQASEAYHSLIESDAENISAVFVYPHSKEEQLIDKPVERITRSALDGKIRVGIIGAGAFIKRNHLANILKMPDDYELVAVAEKTSASSTAFKAQYKVSYVTTDYRQILNDPDIDLVIIGTRHNLHAVLVAESIKAGKHVLVEKPLAMNSTELSLVADAIGDHQNVIAAVGFNRRYSPLIQRAKSVILKNGTPVVINYRVNAGYIPPESWVQDLEEGGGRIIGEVCHFLDLISYLSGGDIKSFDAVHIPVNGTSIKAEDNIIVTLSFENGSIGVLTYTSIGGKEMEKERIEIFTGNSSIVIDDFIELHTYNSSENGLKLKKTDKGHVALVEELAKKIKGRDSLIESFDKDIQSTNLTLFALDRIHKIEGTDLLLSN